MPPSNRKVRFQKAPWMKFPVLNTKIYADAMFSKIPEIHGEKCGTIYTDGHKYHYFFPWKSKSE